MLLVEVFVLSFSEVEQYKVIDALKGSRIASQEQLIIFPVGKI